MKDLALEITPKSGYGEIRFGETSENAMEYLGKPEEIENIQDDDDFNTVILYYFEKGITIFFEGKEKSVISCFETENPDSTLYGKKIFDMAEKDIVDLMTEKGFEVAEVDMEMSGEKRVGYDDAMIDFYFMDCDLVAVNWGVLINDKGEIEEM